MPFEVFNPKMQQNAIFFSYFMKKFPFPGGQRPTALCTVKKSSVSMSSIILGKYRLSKMKCSRSLLQ